jgi:uncharacterized membrane protein YhaH (DUF805 family)
VGEFSIWHWAVVLATLALIAIPATVVVRRGLSPWWVVLALIPGVGVIALWLLAFGKRPIKKGGLHA